MAHAQLTINQLKDLLRTHGIRGYSNKNKAELIAMVQQAGIEIPATPRITPLTPAPVPIVPTRPVSPPRITEPVTAQVVPPRAPSPRITVPIAPATAMAIAKLPKVPALARPAPPTAKLAPPIAKPAPMQIAPFNIANLRPPDNEIPDYIKLYIGDQMTVKYNEIEAYLFWPLTEVTDDEADEYNIGVDVSDAQFIRDELLDERKDTLPRNTKILFIDTMLEYNHFDGTGYHFQDMSITIPNVVTRTPVTGYIEFIVKDGYFSYLYEFRKLNGQPGYLCILHSEGAGYGSTVLTRLAVLI